MSNSDDDAPATHFVYHRAPDDTKSSSSSSLSSDQFISPLPAETPSQSAATPSGLLGADLALLPSLQPRRRSLSGNASTPSPRGSPRGSNITTPPAAADAAMNAAAAAAASSRAAASAIHQAADSPVDVSMPGSTPISRMTSEQIEAAAIPIETPVVKIHFGQGTADSIANQQQQPQRQQTTATQPSKPPSSLLAAASLPVDSSAPPTIPPYPLTAAPSGPAFIQPTETQLILCREAEIALKSSAALDAGLPSSASSSAGGSSSSSSSSADSPAALMKLYGSYEQRLASFGQNGKKWPHTPASHPGLSPASLALWGFYYHADPSKNRCERDCVQCFACQAELYDFEQADEAEESHRLAQLDTMQVCPFLSQIDMLVSHQPSPYSSQRAPKGSAPPAATSPSSVPVVAPSKKEAAPVPIAPPIASSTAAPANTAARTTSASSLDALLSDIDHDHEHAFPFASSSSPPADSDQLPPPSGGSVFDESGDSRFATALDRAPSVQEAEAVVLRESSDELNRPIRSNCGALLSVSGLKVQRLALSDVHEEDLARRHDAEEPVIAQLRTPLLPFSDLEDPKFIRDAALGGAPPKPPSCLYFQIKIHKLTNTPPVGATMPPTPAPEVEIKVEAVPHENRPIDASSSASTAAPSSLPQIAHKQSYPPLIIGLLSHPLHAHSHPPGFDPPGLDLLNIGFTSWGDINLNGMGPLSGIVAQQNLHYYPMSLPAGDWKEGDVIGCKVDLARSLLLWHVNGKQLGPVVLPPPTKQHLLALQGGLKSNEADDDNAAVLSSFSFYPTVSLLHAGDKIEFQLSDEAALRGPDWEQPLHSAQPTPAATTQGVAALSKSWHLDPIETCLNASSAKFSDMKPDLGLVLDQTNSTSRRSGSVIVRPKNAEADAATASSRARQGSMIAMPSNATASSSGGAKAAEMGGTVTVGPVVISKILPGFSADQAGLRVGDQIKSINGSPVVMLKDAVAIVTSQTPAAILSIGIIRGGKPFLVRLTLGAKGVTPEEFGPLARWIQYQRHLMEWIGPPVLQHWSSRPSTSAGAGVGAPKATSPDGAASLNRTLSESLPVALLPPPPPYDDRMAESKPMSGAEHIRALEVALQVQGRLIKHQNTPLYLPQYKTLASRMRTFESHMQTWMQQRSGKSSVSASSSAIYDNGSSSTAAGIDTIHPPKPLNVAIHGFLYAPVQGFPGRVVCFACGVVVNNVNSCADLITCHRQLARSQKQSNQRLHTLDRPPSYHREAEQFAGNHPSFETGCLFLTLYDAVSKSITAKIKAKALSHASKGKKGVAASASSSATSSVTSLTNIALVPGVVGSVPAPAPDVVLDVEMDDNEVDRATAALTEGAMISSSQATTPTGSFSTPVFPPGASPTARSRKALPGAVQSNVDNLARNRHNQKPAAATTLVTVAQLPPFSDEAPPDYSQMGDHETIPCGDAAAAASSKDRSHEYDGLIFQNPVMNNPRTARAGEFTQGSIDLPTSHPLTPFELRARRKGMRNPAGAGAAGGVRFQEDPVGYIPPGAYNNIGGNVAQQPPPEPVPPPDPVQTLKEFFLGGNPIFLICKVPFFILVLPFFLLWECLKGIYRGISWCCDALERACDRCCGACSRACHRCCNWISLQCGRCLNFFCCTLLCDHLCFPIYRAGAWVCRKMNEHCFQPCIRGLTACCRFIGRQISRCFKAISDTIAACCSWIDRVCCTPCAQAIASCCRAISNAISSCCRAIATCCERMCEMISKCCRWFWTPICDAIASCFSAIWRAISAICSALYRCTAAICRAIGSCLSAIYHAIASCCHWFWDGVARCCAWVCHQIAACFRAIFRCIDYVIIQPIAWVCRQIWACLKICFEYLIVKPLKAIWSCLTTIASFIWNSILAPIGRAISWVFSMIWQGLSAIARGIWAVLSAIGNAIWAVLSAIGRAIGAVFSAIYNGVLVPIGEAISSAGRAIKNLCA